MDNPSDATDLLSCIDRLKDLLTPSLEDRIDELRNLRAQLTGTAMDEPWRDALAALAAWHRAYAARLAEWPIVATAHIAAAGLLEVSSRRPYTSRPGSAPRKCDPGRV